MQASVAIEGNTLSLEQVTDVLDGKRMQIELPLHLIELRVGRIVQRHPHEAISAREIFVLATSATFRRF